jgi:hypothetical protein
MTGNSNSSLQDYLKKLKNVTKVKSNIIHSKTIAVAPIRIISVTPLAATEFPIILISNT